MLIIYSLLIFILSSSAIMIGYVLIRDIQNTRAQAANLTGQNEETLEETQPSEEIVAEYPQLMKKIA